MWLLNDHVCILGISDALSFVEVLAFVLLFGLFPFFVRRRAVVVVMQSEPPPQQILDLAVFGFRGSLLHYARHAICSLLVKAYHQ